MAERRKHHLNTLRIGPSAGSPQRPSKSDNRLDHIPHRHA
ncbi:hypothetical protein FHU30_003724 [Actinomadura rupiterrae]|nr:hypothetical protein [Actinomadura rupiterrae]